MYNVNTSKSEINGFKAFQDSKIIAYDALNLKLDVLDSKKS